MHRGRDAERRQWQLHLQPGGAARDRPVAHGVHRQRGGPRLRRLHRPHDRSARGACDRAVRRDDTPRAEFRIGRATGDRGGQAHCRAEDRTVGDHRAVRAGAHRCAGRRRPGVRWRVPSAWHRAGRFDRGHAVHRRRDRADRRVAAARARSRVDLGWRMRDRRGSRAGAWFSRTCAVRPRGRRTACRAAELRHAEQSAGHHRRRGAAAGPVRARPAHSGPAAGVLRAGLPVRRAGGRGTGDRVRADGVAPHCRGVAGSQGAGADAQPHREAGERGLRAHHRGHRPAICQRGHPSRDERARPCVLVVGAISASCHRASAGDRDRTRDRMPTIRARNAWLPGASRRPGRADDARQQPGSGGRRGACDRRPRGAEDCVRRHRAQKRHRRRCT